jgi:KDO2-lipid IV(A) lauroyltransferase
LRDASGCLFFERRFEGGKLRAAMNRPGMMLGLLCDQDGGERGLQLPFLGPNCSTSPATALFALRYDCLLYSAICYRVGLAQWRIECGDEISTHSEGKPRSSEAIMRDVNAALEVGVRRDPANWFWVHNRWKRGKPGVQAQPEAA